MIQSMSKTLKLYYATMLSKFKENLSHSTHFQARRRADVAETSRIRRQLTLPGGAKIPHYSDVKMSLYSRSSSALL